MSYSRRHIDLKFQLGKGSFGEDGTDVVDISGLRVSCNISTPGGVSMSRMQMRVFGMKLETMNKLSILGKPLQDGRFNVVTVSAGSDEGGMAVAFQGVIQEAWVDMANAPEATFYVDAHTSLLDALKPVAPTSYKGSVDAAVAIAGLGKLMTPPRTLENNGVSVQLSNPYWAGTPRDQAIRIARDGNFNILFDETADVIAIWPKDGSRNGQQILLSANTGMVGYPAHTQNGIMVTTLYNPGIAFGRPIMIESALTPANGTWVPFTIGHDLESEMPGGKWFTTLECSILGHALGIG